jgi:succinate dehydrogenase/fumarate reductase flavoprotein subunit
MPLSTGGAIFVNQDGNRFWREDGRRDDLSKAAMVQNEDAIFWVVESSEAIPDPTTTKTTDGRTVQYMLDNNLSDYVTGDTIEELAANMGVDAENLRVAIEDYNAHVDSQEPDAFGRTLFTTKLATAPYYAFTRAPSAHHTLGGININENAQVLDTDGNVIPGLYAAGEVTGGIHGGNRLGGNATVDVVVFGRIAGTNAAAEE